MPDILDLTQNTNGVPQGDAPPHAPDPRPAYAQGAPPDPTQGFPSLPSQPFPQPPSLADSMTPPPSRGGPIKSLLTRFAYGAGQALMAHAGLKTDFDIQKEQFDQQLATSRQDLLRQQQEFNQKLVPTQFPDGTVRYLPQSASGKVETAIAKGQSSENVANTNLKGKQQANSVTAARNGYKIDSVTGQPVPRTYEDLSPVQQAVADLAEARASSEPQKLALAAAKLRNAIANGGGSSASGNKRSDSSYNYNNTQLNTIGKPLDDLMGRLGRLQDTLRIGNPQSDALVAPELLTVMAGGMGSGLRINEAEISRIVGGVGHWQKLKADIQKWSLNPDTANSITDSQRQQIRALTGAVESKLQARQSILLSARDQLAATTDITKHRQIVNDARRQLHGVDESSLGKGQSGGAGPSGSSAPPASGDNFFGQFGGKSR